MRFYFEIEENGVLASDHDGEDLPDAEAARHEALRTLGEMIKRSAVHNHVSRIVVSIRDEQGRKVTECSASVQSFDQAGASRTTDPHNSAARAEPRKSLNG